MEELEELVEGCLEAAEMLERVVELEEGCQEVQAHHQDNGQVT